MKRLYTTWWCCALMSATGCAGPSGKETPFAASVPAGDQRHRCRPTALDAGPPVRPRSLSRSERAALEAIAHQASGSIVLVHAAHRRSVRGSVAKLATVSTAARSGGTGIVVAADGVILTGAHVVTGAAEVIVRTPDGRRHRVSRMEIDRRLDLAALYAPTVRLSPLPRAIMPPSRGAAVVAVAADWPQYPRPFRTGVITQPTVSLQRQLDPQGRRDYGRLLESSTRLGPGFSGGPLLNAAGRLVGINIAVAGQPDTADLRGYTLALDGETNRIVLRLVNRSRRVPVPSNPQPARAKR